MVDKDKIRDLWIKYFDHDQEQLKSGNVTINSDGSVSVNDSVFLLTETIQLPIKLDKVEGNFDAIQMGLADCYNFPDYVRNDLDLRYNQITTLVGAPSFVGDSLRLSGNPLKDLSGFPRHVGGKVTVTWHRDLPLLRTLVAKEIVVYGQPRVMAILNKYAGKPHERFDCQKDLIDANFAGNARW